MLVMKKTNCYVILILILCFSFMENVFADNFSVSADGGNSSVSKGTEVKVLLNLKSDVSISDCMFKFENDNTLEYIGVSSLNNWEIGGEGANGTLLSNKSLNASAPSNGQNIAELKYKINGNGKLTIKTLECISIEDEEVYSYKDLIVNFSIKESNNNSSTAGSNNSTGSNNNDNKIDEVGDVTIAPATLKDIILSEGEIDFNPLVSEYEIKVKDFSSLTVSLDFDNGSSSYTIDKVDNGDEKSVVIVLTDLNDETTTYKIKVTEENTDEVIQPSDDEVVEPEKKKGNYVPVFIGIICLLVLINVFRIVKSIKK